MVRRVSVTGPSASPSACGAGWPVAVVTGIASPTLALLVSLLFFKLCEVRIDVLFNLVPKKRVVDEVSADEVPPEAAPKKAKKCVSRRRLPSVDEDEVIVIPMEVNELPVPEAEKAAEVGIPSRMTSPELRAAGVGGEYAAFDGPDVVPELCSELSRDVVLIASLLSASAGHGVYVDSFRLGHHAFDSTSEGRAAEAEHLRADLDDAELGSRIYGDRIFIDDGPMPTIDRFFPRRLSNTSEYRGPYTMDDEEFQWMRRYRQEFDRLSTGIADALAVRSDLEAVMMDSILGRRSAIRGCGRYLYSDRCEGRGSGGSYDDCGEGSSRGV